MNTYPGKTPLWSEVSLDFEKKTYHFNYGEIKFWDEIFSIMAPYYIPPLIISLILLIPISILWLVYDLSYLFMGWGIALGFIFSFTFLMSLVIYFSSDEIKNEIHPKIATKFIRNFFKNNIRFKDINSTQIYIPEASNIYFEYKAYGDYKKYLKTIDIKKFNYNKKDFKWYILINFNKIPKIGYMDVEWY